PPTGKGFTQLASRFAEQTCVLVSDGTFGCWGSNRFGQAPASQFPPTGTTFTQVSVGGTTTCAVVSDGSVGCLGYNGLGQAPGSQVPPAGTRFTQVSAGQNHTCAVVSDGT